MKNFTVIDRLPFENVDIGLVSGYDRYSAFTVIPDLSSVTYEVGTLTNTTDARGAFSGTEVQGVKVSYSSDKHSSLDEHAGDWMGESGNMNWQDTPTSEIVIRNRSLEGNANGLTLIYHKVFEELHGYRPSAV